MLRIPAQLSLCEVKLERLKWSELTRMCSVTVRNITVKDTMEVEVINVCNGGSARSCESSMHLELVDELNEAGNVIEPPKNDISVEVLEDVELDEEPECAQKTPKKDISVEFLEEVEMDEDDLNLEKASKNDMSVEVLEEVSRKVEISVSDQPNCWEEDGGRRSLDTKR